MRIVHISVTNNLVPPEGYGGVERVVHWLGEAQLEMGHEVFAVAPKGGSSKIENIPVPLWSSEETAYEKSYQSILDLKPDIIHDHTFSQLFRLRHPEIPAVSYRHNERFQPVSHTVYPSKSYASENGSSTFVHLGLNPNGYDYSEEKEDYLLFLGAIHPRKNVDIAIKMARAAKIPLKIAGPVRHAGYFCKKIRKKLSSEIVYHGEALGVIKNQLLKQARAVLYPSSWESFGIVVIEANLSGTPVIVSDIPPFHETVRHGVTGFICNTKKDYLKAIEQLETIQPADCRDSVMSRFTSIKMAEAWQGLYQKALDGKTW